MEQFMPLIAKFSKSLVRFHSEEDYRDLAQDVYVKLLQYEGDLTEGLILTIIKNTWRDRLAYKSLRLTGPIEWADKVIAFASFQQEDAAQLNEIIEFATLEQILMLLNSQGQGKVSGEINPDTKKIFNLRKAIRNKYESGIYNS